MENPFFKLNKFNLIPDTSNSFENRMKKTLLGLDISDEDSFDNRVLDTIKNSSPKVGVDLKLNKSKVSNNTNTTASSSNNTEVGDMDMYKSMIKSSNKEYRDSIKPLLFGLGMEMPALLQKTPTLDALPYATVNAPRVFSPIEPSRNAVLQGIGYSASLGNKLKELGDTGLTASRSLLGGLADSANKSNLDIAGKEAEYLNKEAAARQTALDATEVNRVDADIKRIDAQMKINAGVSTERSKAMSNIFKTIQLLDAYKKQAKEDKLSASRYILNSQLNNIK